MKTELRGLEGLFVFFFYQIIRNTKRIKEKRVRFAPLAASLIIGTFLRT